MSTCHLNVVIEVVQTLQLCADRDQSDVVGDLSVCLDGMTVDPEMFATAEADHHSESQTGQNMFFLSFFFLLFLPPVIGQFKNMFWSSSEVNFKVERVKRVFFQTFAEISV